MHESALSLESLDVSEAPDLRVHRLFERQAAECADEAAVICGDERLTYRQLNARANQVARYLQKRGVRPQELVGVAMRRSPLMVVALLGIWKAGCAYVPLDPSYPAARLAFMASDAKLRLLLTDSQSREAFAAIDRCLVVLDDEQALHAQEADDDVSGAGSSSDLAYVMYTSGSTGQPKGAMITHGGLANYLCWAVDAYDVRRGGSVPVHSSLSFDLTVTSLYVPLLAGAHVELLPEEGGVQALLGALRARKRSLVKITPAHLELLSHELRPDELADVADIFVIGGEKLMAERLSAWRTHAPATRLVNEYGPTETVVGCCIHEVGPRDSWEGSVPIGHAIAHTELYVLDDALRPMPLGEAGELYIGGRGVARGYLGKPQLTQDRFVPDPFSGRPGARLYRTGDAARYRKGGRVLEYLGRLDDQVKVRGYRVELGEIEAALSGHPDVRTCAALAREDREGDRELAAFAVARQGAQLTAGDLSAFLRERLPAFAVPRRVLVLDALPLNHNGKVDRAALQSIVAAGADGGDTAAMPPPAPRTATEELVMKSFRDIFQRTDIGLSDSFFDIGGHSMLAVRLLAALRAATGLNLPLRNLYEHPTVGGLAGAIDALQWSCDGERATGPRIGKEAGRTQVSF